MLKKLTEKNGFPYLILFVLVIAGYWQVVFMQHPLKWDMIDCYYPWRYMVGESLRNGMLPLWNPYQVLGYPVHADPQSGAWYPLTWFIGFLFGYDIYTVHIEYLFHLLLAAAGMYYLCGVLNIDKRAGFIVAVSYVFSGFFIGNAQHLTYTISGAWIPFALAHYIKLYNTHSIRHAFYVSFFLFMLISGGYPAFLFIFFYLLLILFLFFVVKIIVEKKYEFLKVFLLNHVAVVVSTLLLSAVVLVSVFYMMPYITRGGNVPIEMANYCPLSPQSLISFILPFAVIRDMGFYNTDLSMSNVYFGLIPLIFFVYGLFKKPPLLYWIFLVFGIVCLAAAMGNYLPVRNFLYEYVPLMGMFRFPSLFRYFVILLFLLVSAYGIHQYFVQEKNKDRVLFVIGLFLVLVFVSIVIYSRWSGYLVMKEFVKNELFKFSDVSSIRQHIVFQSGIQLLLLIMFFASIIFFRDLKKIFLVVFLIVAIDAIISAQLNAPYTVYYDKFTVKETKNISRKFVKGFPVPGNNKVSEHCDTCGLGEAPFWKNLNTFYKQIAYDGFAPIVFNGYSYMVDSLPDVFNALIQNPPVYFAKTIFPETAAVVHQKQGTTNPGYCYLPEDVFLKNIGFNQDTSNVNDTVFFTSFSPNNMVLETQSATRRFLCLQQNYYPGWNVKINDNETTITQVNFGLMGVDVPQGKNKINFYFKPWPVVISFYISLLSLLCFVIFLIISWVQRRKKTIRN